jgi:hypothetical protein
MAEESFLRVCPIHFHFLSVVWPATGFFCALQVALVQNMLKIFPRHLFINVCDFLCNLWWFASTLRYFWNSQLCCNRYIPRLLYLI